MTDLGFDEGGVLQALATPILHQEVTTVKTSKKGKVTTSKTVFELTGAQVIALLLGSSLLALFLRFKDLTDEDKEQVERLVKFGPFAPYTAGVAEWNAWLLKKGWDISPAGVITKKIAKVIG